jgi:SAM-dependent methyltransferase
MLRTGSNIIDIQNEILKHKAHEYYATYKQYEEAYWKRIPSWIDQLRDIDRTLDIGCGYGTLALYACTRHNCQVYCLDNKQYLSNDIIDKYKFHYHISNIETEDWPKAVIDTPFDLVIMTEVLEHLSTNPVVILNRLKSLLSDHGVILLSTPDAKYWGKIDKYYSSWRDIPERSLLDKDEHIYQYDEKELRDIFKLSGLRIKKFESCGGYNGLHHFNAQLSRAPESFAGRFACFRNRLKLAVLSRMAARFSSLLAAALAAVQMNKPVSVCSISTPRRIIRRLSRCI